jgi:hypothetical protein
MSLRIHDPFKQDYSFRQLYSVLIYDHYGHFTIASVPTFSFSFVDEVLRDDFDWVVCLCKFCAAQANEASMQRLAESELIHGRWAMLGVAGSLAVELLGFGNWFDAPLWAVKGETASYFGVPVPFDVTTIVLVELVLMAGAEILRNEEKDTTKRSYPGVVLLLP